MRIAGTLGVALATVVLGGCGSGHVPEAAPRLTSTPAPSVAGPPPAMRWVSSYGVEVAVPKAWRPGRLSFNEPCVRGGRETRSPYVEIGQLSSVAIDMLCVRKEPTDMPAEFGQVAFRLWQPHVTLRRADLVDGAQMGTWTYRGWRLQRTRIGRLSIAVLTDARQPGLGARVIASAHGVAVDRLGCASVAPPQLAQMRPPPGSLIPPATEVGSIAVCEYDRTRPGAPWMAADVSIGGARARAIVRAIRAAPPGGGPDRPQNCLSSMHGDEALVLHFLARGTRPSPKDPQVFVYSDWCVGNGIVDGGGRHTLTRASCRPLYVQPVVLWSAQSNVAPLCMTP